MKKSCLHKNHEGDREMSILAFSNNKSRKDGLHYYCKGCMGREKVNWKKQNPESAAMSQARSNARHYKLYKDKVNEANNKRYKQVANQRRIKYSENIEHYHAAQARSRKKRKENGKANKAEKARKANSLNYKLSQLARGRRKSAIKAQSAKKLMKHIDSLGCTIGFYKNYIESKFLPGMTWENHGRGEGKWQIDEIKPCASFDLSDPEQYKECFHYTNAQPLWAIDNMKKSSIYEGVRYVNKKAA